MTQEDKQLLLKDLCARLPYSVKLKHIPSGENTTLEIIGCGVIDGNIHDLIENFKPYLRPISSMTEEEKKEYNYMVFDYEYDDYWYPGKYTDAICVGGVDELVDWLNAHYFDYRGLIEKGLAIAVTEENNPYKD